MLVAPVVVGAVAAGPRWWHLLLLVTWLVAYLAFFATGLWLRARRKPKYLPPVRAYAIATAVLGLATLALEPAVLRWGLVYGPLLLVSLGFSARRDDRSMTNDLVTVAAACLMAVVVHAPVTTLESAPHAGWLPGGADGSAWLLAALLFAYFAGTVPYVKTMIRERGNRAMYRGSVAYHAAVTALLATVAVLPDDAFDRWGSGDAVALLDGPTPWLLAALFAGLTVRAAVVPRRWPTASPKAVGIGEIVATTLLALVLLLG